MNYYLCYITCFQPPCNDTSVRQELSENSWFNRSYLFRGAISNTKNESGLGLRLGLEFPAVASGAGLNSAEGR